jgi:hypothetical protein
MNPLKGKLFNAVARLESALAEFSRLLDQRRQMWCHFRFTPLVLDLQGEQKFVHPLWLDVHIYQQPSVL